MRLREKILSVREKGFYTAHDGVYVRINGDPVIFTDEDSGDEFIIQDFGSWKGLIPLRESK